MYQWKSRILPYNDYKIHIPIHSVDTSLNNDYTSNINQIEGIYYDTVYGKNQHIYSHESMLPT